MSETERKDLHDLVKRLDIQQMKGIIALMADTVIIESDAKIISFDLKDIPVRKQRELEAYVKKCLCGAATDRRKKVIAMRLN